MTEPRWRLEDLIIWYPRWLEDYDPVPEASRDAVFDWVEKARQSGPSDNVILLDDEEGTEGFEPIDGTRVTVSILLYRGEHRIVVTRITGR
jgi:hypothetical protein